MSQSDNHTPPSNVNKPPNSPDPDNPEKSVSKLQTLEQLTRIPHFIPDRIFPFLCGRDQLQLAHSSRVLLRELKYDLPPKIVCKKCLKTLISTAIIPDHVRFLLSESPYSTTVAVALCHHIQEDPLDSDEMNWARDKFYVGKQQHKGTPVLHCARCRSIVGILLTQSIHEPAVNWIKNLAHADTDKYEAAQLIVPLHSGTKFIEL